MSSLVQRFAVTYEYRVYFTRDMLDPANPRLAEAFANSTRLLCVIDQGVADAWPELEAHLMQYCASASIPLVGTQLVPGGEAAKQDPRLVEAVQQQIASHGIDRHGAVLVVGGGAVQDMAGFAAATAHRGVRLIRAPTTVLSQNDGGVGVKNGINGFGCKNFVGTFAPPFAVINDSTFLRTLSDRDRRSGIAEAVKVALIRDAAFFEWIESAADDLAAQAPAALEALIRRCAELHLRHISEGGDPFEHGSARPLDFGHWSAHKLEQLTHFGLRHGEAVAIGISLDTRYSAEIGWLPTADTDRVAALLEKLGFTLWSATLEQRSADGRRAVLAGLEEFREHLGGELTVTLLREIGRGEEVHAMRDDAIEASIQWMRERR